MGLKEDLQNNQRIMRDMGIGGDSGQPEFYQYQWDLQEKNPKYDPRGTSEQPIFKYTLQDQSPNSVIKDVIDETGKKVGAYNTQTGFKYGLTNPDLVKNQNDIVNSQSPDSSVNQTVNSVMNNSLLTSPTPASTTQKRSYISPEDVAKMNPIDNTLGRNIGGKIGETIGGVVGFLSGGAAGSIGGPPGSLVGAGLGTAGGIAGGHQVGSRIGGDLDYFFKGLNETTQENLPNVIQSEKYRRLNQEQQGGMGTEFLDSVK